MSSEAAVALWGALIVATGVAILILSALVGPRRSRPEKFDPYECGVPLLQDARERFSVHFYLMAILFILFDIEMVFLLPWALLHRTLGVAGFVEILVFMAVLGFGFVYIWRRGVLDWTRES